MKYFYDTEFIDDGRTIELISIGVAAEDGREYYGISSEFNPDRAGRWVRTNVLPKLPREGRKSRALIAQEIRGLVLGALPWPSRRPEFWAYFADYDWVVFCQLYGRMIELPEGFPMYCNDLKQLMHERHIDKDDLPQQSEGSEHDALADARWVRSAWLWIHRRDD